MGVVGVRLSPSPGVNISALLKKERSMPRNYSNLFTFALEDDLNLLPQPAERAGRSTEVFFRLPKNEW
jgi:hypothetical protein